MPEPVLFAFLLALLLTDVALRPPELRRRIAGRARRRRFGPRASLCLALSFCALVALAIAALPP